MKYGILSIGEKFRNIYYKYITMYIPKSQIKTNLHTNGGEYQILSTGAPYSGPYYKLSNGEIYTGTSPDTPLTTQLTPLQSQEDSIISYPTTSLPRVISLNIPNNYNTLKSINFDNSFSYNPEPFITLPTPEDYKVGKFTRYFTKKTNELKYKEISEDTYKKLKNRSEEIAWDLYEPVKIEWEIKGNKILIFNNNKLSVSKVEQHNKWYGFFKYLKEDYIKYWKP
jgi:hypothetical protein